VVVEVAALVVLVVVRVAILAVLEAQDQTRIIQLQ
jgi:hypothetical protein